MPGMSDRDSAARLCSLHPFVQPRSCFPLEHAGKVVGTITLGGPDLLMPVGSRTVLFEMHGYCGPMPISKKTGEELKRIPAGFWDAYDRWVAGGKLVADGVCYVREWCPKCRGCGEERRHIGGRSYEFIGDCKDCSGSGLSP